MAEIVVRHRYAHPPETVFDAWLDPKTAGRFAFATPDGEMIVAEVDARVGGRFTFTDRRPDMGAVAHVGAYEVIDRPRRLVFTFAVPQFDPGSTRVTLDFAAAAGGCELTLTHEGVPPEYQDQTPKGWEMILAALERVVL
ncbi:SRPBCC domain-containing protein [Phenylobacterium sp.]|uniref:SRPBCC family protein n=1 Tax=Phenylobacterium sp. TaxID=1871053 RepID=UPI0025FBD2BA|nr:SRPBCC domain-containing protein [Phenylobacterium sp.]